MFLANVAKKARPASEDVGRVVGLFWLGWNVFDYHIQGSHRRMEGSASADVQPISRALNFRRRKPYRARPGQGPGRPQERLLTLSSGMLDALAAVDTLPVGQRADLGRTLMSWLHEVAGEEADHVRWRFRQVQFPDRPPLIFAAATRWDEAVHNAFQMLVTLRHQQMVEALGGPRRLLTVGMLLTPRRDGRRAWDTTMAAASGISSSARNTAGI